MRISGCQFGDVNLTSASYSAVCEIASTQISMGDRGKGRYFHSEILESVSDSVPFQKKLPGSILKKKSKTPEDKLKYATKKKEIAKKKQEKKRRIIIRNLSFKIDEKELKNILSKYGNVTDLKIPKKPDGKKKGFAFAQFEKFQSTVQAIKNLNYKELHGRPVAIDYALPKDKYEDLNSSKLTNEKDSSAVVDKSIDGKSGSESEASDDDEDMEVKEASVNEEPQIKKKDNERVDDMLKELEFGDTDDEVNADDNEGTSDSSEDEDDDEDDETDSSKPEGDKCGTSSVKSPTKSKQELDTSKKVPSNDVQEGKTVFVRNIPFDTTQENFREAMEEFGPVKYCLLCIDPVTEFPRGTAFVKFENKDDAEKLIQKSSDETGTGVFFENRKLYCVPAMSREEAKQKTAGGPKEKKDKRNLRLLREGLIMASSEEAEGVSQTDLAKRSKLEVMKKQKLKNLNFFVSDTRLCIHNLPPTYTDQELRRLFREAVPGKAVITEARIMRDMKKVNEKGDSKSKGFGFVSFAKHEHALEALWKLNNNPSTFSDQKRPIVEFSVENHLALLSKQRRRERNQLRNKRKQEDRSNDDQQSQVEKNSKFGNKRQRTWKPQGNSSIKKKFQKHPPDVRTDAKESKKTKNKKTKQKKGTTKKEYKNVMDLADQYKAKLLNKLK